MAQKKYTDGSGVGEIWLNVKNYVYSQLLGKQNTLVSGTNIKTVNGNSLLGSGNITISGGVSWGNITGNITNQTDLQTALNNIDCGTMS